MKRTNYSIRFQILLLLGIVSLIEYIVDIFNSNITLTNFYIIQLLIIYVLGFVECVRKLGIYNLFSLIISLFFVFVLGGIAVSPFFEYSIRVAVSPDYQEFPEYITQKTLVIYSVFFSCIFIFYFFNYHKSSQKIILKDSQYRKKIYSIGRLILLLTFPVALLYGMELMSSDARTNMLIDGGSSAPLPLRIAHMLFTVAFYLIVASVPTKKQFLTSFFIYLIALIPVLMGGERGEVVVPIIFLVWYLNKFYKYKIKLRFLVIGGVFIMVMSYIIVFLRLDQEIDNTNIALLIFGFFASSSTSFKLMSWYLLYKDHILNHTYPFFLDSVIGGMLGASGQNVETLQVRSSIGHQLVYAINPDYYLSGASMGTAFVTESYEFGIIGVIIGAFIFIQFVKFVENKAWHYRITMFFLYYQVQLLLLSPRGAFLPGIYDILKFGGLVSVIMLFYGISLFKKKVNHK